jgi:mevalonate kinase
MFRSRACGKIILFGEHAVVYGQPALAVPVNELYADAEVSVAAHAGIVIHAPEVGIHAPLSRLAPDNPLAAVVDAVFAALNTDIATCGGTEIKITSTIPIAAGLGSGAAVSVAIARALSAYLGNPLDDEQINRIAYEVEKIHHGTPSGIDNTVVTYAKPVYFLKGEGEHPLIERLRVAKPFTVLIADSGIPAPTKESVADVRKERARNPRRMDTLFAAVGSIVRTARQAIEGGHPEYLGALMNENHRILQEMGVSSAILDRLTEASLNSGANGAKLSGGGRGGNVIALSTNDNAPAVAEALLHAGAKNVIQTEVR